MYYTKKTQTGSTRFIGLGFVIGVNALVAVGLASGLGQQVVAKLTETEVVIIQEEVKPDEEPPPPPPVDVELPPPPPQVVLPEFTFDTPPSPNAVAQVTQVPNPAPRPEVRPAPPAPPAPVRPSVPPKVDARRFGEMLQDDYPAASLRAKEEGVVTVAMCVSEVGRISDVKLVKSSGFPRLDEAAVKGIARQRMSQPAKDGAGKPVAWCNPPYQLDVQWKMPGR